MAWSVRAQEESPAANEGPLVPTPGEIRLEGTIESIDLVGLRFTLRATSFALPSGRSAGIAEPTLKTIQISPDALLFARGAPGQKVAAQLLRRGWRAAVTGRNEGGSKPFAARSVAVWTRGENGQYRLDLDPNAAPPAGAPPTAGNFITLPAAPPAVVPPAVNVLENGDFEDLDDKLRPRGWAFPEGGAVSVIEDDEGNHFVQLPPRGGGDDRRIGRSIEVKPDWKSLKVVARVRARNFQMGPNPWDHAHVSLFFFNAQNEKIANEWPITLRGDSDWRRRVGTANVPAGATRVEVDASSFGSEGDFSVDSISVSPNAPLEGVALRAGFPEGAFEDLDAAGRSLSWSFDNTSEMGVVAEGGNHFLRLSLPKPGYIGSDLFVHLEPDTRRVRVQARVRAQNVALGKEGWEKPRLGLAFTDARGEKVGEWPPSIDIAADTDWAPQSQEMDAPAGAVFLRLTPQLLNAGGTLDIDDIQISTEK